jgi:hypothetical protein
MLQVKQVALSYTSTGTSVLPVSGHHEQQIEVIIRAVATASYYEHLTVYSYYIVPSYSIVSL